MAEYISRDLALSFPFATGEYDREHADPHFIGGCETYREWLEQLPAADVAEVRHGKWVWNGETCCNECSVCGVGAMWFRILMEYHYCPNCGAKMDEENDDG